MANNGRGGQGPLTGVSSTRGGMQGVRGRGRRSSRQSSNGCGNARGGGSGSGRYGISECECCSSRHGSSGRGNARGGGGSSGQYGISECGRGRGRGGCGSSRRGDSGCGSGRGGAGSSCRCGSDSGVRSNSSDDATPTTLSDVAVQLFAKQVGPTTAIPNTNRDIQYFLFR